MAKHRPKMGISVGGWHLMDQRMAFGNPTQGGFKTVDKALRGVAGLNTELEAKFGLVLPVSAHYVHELQVPSDLPKVNPMAQCNSPRSISIDEWMEGAKAGTHAPIGRIIPPGFGLPWSDEGALIHPDPNIRRLHKDLMVLSFATSMRVKQIYGCIGEVIYWTGPDGIRWRRLVKADDVRLGYKLNPKLEEWKLIVSGLVVAVNEAIEQGCTDQELLIEGKAAGDPCYLDVFTDTQLEVMGIKAINAGVNSRVAQFQPEFAHERGAGIRFYKALQIGIKAGVFGGNIHLNSGGLGQTNFAKLLARRNGTPASKFPQYVDNDFLPGEGPAEWIDDQERSLGVCARWSARTGRKVNIEFDARFSRYADTIGALRKSVLWTVDCWNRQCKALGLVS